MRRANARSAVVWEDLDPLLTDGQRLEVLDIGGGTGVSAVRIAELGHRVSVIDPSPDALAALARRAREADVEVTAHQGDLALLGDAVAAGDIAPVDLVLCHGVLEVVSDTAAALTGIRDALRPSGALSLLVGQRSAAVLARAMAGHFGQARDLLDDTSALGRSGRRFTVDEVTSAVRSAGLEVHSVHGVRVFTDLVPGSLLDLEPGAASALVDLELAVAARSDYLPMATQLHLIATR
ncbi:MAG: methyltransferase domain-containing protein [Nocardioides sp.]|uniref:methyltransferase n=1 Tax=Nocardioides sp. TaxID=35761 RepID=UPI0039E4D222